MSRRSRRWPRALLILLGLASLALAGLWLARKPLATRYADRFLADKGVPARYRIADLGLGRQRLVNVVLGDPADPDLVADWLEARTAVGLSGPYLTGVGGGHVRVRARWVDGRLSLGSIDRLLPKGDPSKPFSLPALSLDIADLRARVETPVGVLGVKLSGRGRLDGGFDGRLAVTAARLGQPNCAAAAPRAALTLRSVAASPLRPASVRIDGSAEAAGAACATMAAGYTQLSGRGTLNFGERPAWQATTDLAMQAVRHPLARAASLGGRVSVDSEGVYAVPMHARASGRPAVQVDLSAGQLAAGDVRAASLGLTGTWRQGPRGGQFAGDLNIDGGDARAAVPAFAGVGGATPVGPLLDRAATAVRAAAARFNGSLGLVVDTGSGIDRVQLNTVRLQAASGTILTATGGPGLAWRDGRFGGGTTLAIRGGGLPEGSIRLDSVASGLRGVATVQPYAAGDARLAVTPVGFAYGPKGWQIATQATLSGPLGDGRVEAVSLPIEASGTGSLFTLGSGCVPIGWQRIAVSGLVLDRGGVRLCSEGGPLLSLRDGGPAGTARLGATRLTGRLGTTPLTLAAAGARLTLGERGFAIRDVAARLGQPGRVSRLDLAAIDGRLTPTGIAGRFTGGAGQISAVPLLLSDAAGSWRLVDGALAVDGGLTVSDAQVDRPRLRPLPVRDVALTLRGNAVEARGTVRSPDLARTVAIVRLGHDLRAGSGQATFAVPDLVFDKTLQPDQLTPVTFGVVADVRGTVAGEGRIDWSPAGVTSTGRFATAGTDLAAAFGPVQGIAGTIRFTDLLALESAPGQTFGVREVNPGIPVTDGTVVFQTLRDARVAVAGARWPFAGGTLTLQPTLLDFGQAAQRRMTFRVDGAATDQFLQQFDFKNLDATGIFDGELPMVFDQAGGRIENGRLQVRPGGGTIAYVGAISQKDIGFWPNLAFQALKSLRYRSLGITMNGPLAGEMVTEVRFAGVSQGEGAARGGITGLLVGRLQRLPFVFNIRIQAPFRGLLDSTASFYDPRRLIQRNLPQLIEEQNKRLVPAPEPVQPLASEPVP